MPRYFFKFQDGPEELWDVEGQVFDGPSKGRELLIKVLCDLAQEGLPDGDFHVFKAQLFDEAGTALYEASLTLRGKWLCER